MGFYFRKSASFGPFRVNLSKSGLGYSVGGRGFRTGVSAKGRKYTRVSLRGTGMGYQTSKFGCALPLAAGLTVAAGGAAVLKGLWHAWSTS
jgi:hypothetical protein